MCVQVCELLAKNAWKQVKEMVKAATPTDKASRQAGRPRDGRGQLKMFELLRRRFLYGSGRLCIAPGWHGSRNGAAAVLRLVAVSNIMQLQREGSCCGLTTPAGLNPPSPAGG